MVLKNMFGLAGDEQTNAVEFIINSIDLRLIIFDLHGTVTCRTSVHPYHLQYRNNYIKSRVVGVDDQMLIGEIDEVFERFPELDKYAYYRYRDQDSKFRFEKIHKPLHELDELLEQVNHQFITVLYSDSRLIQIDRILSAIELEDCFDDIISLENDMQKTTSNKSVCELLCNRYGLLPRQILIIGDNMDKDILPVLKAGGNAIRVKSEHYLTQVLKEFLSKYCGQKIEIGEDCNQRFL